MIALDTNILVHAHRTDSEWHEQADRVVTEVAESGRAWAIPWPCLHEFFAIATHPRIFAPPSTPAQAIAEIECWLASPGLTLLSEDDGYWESLRRHVARGRVRGPAVHDARVAALCTRHGVRELWTADRDFSRFPGLRTRNPLIG